MTRPTVSVVLPTYNREALLPRAIDSVIAQTVQDWEIVLVDDGSTDGTTSLADRYRRELGAKLVYLRQANTGCCGARNRGIDASRGRFVAFLDSDDEFMPDKLERQLALFERCPDLGLVYSDFAFVDEEGVRHESAFDQVCPLARTVPYLAVADGLCVCTGNLFDVLIRGYFIATIVGMVRREVLGSRIRFTRDPSYSEEWLFYLKVARACGSGFVDEPLSLHHHVPGSVTRTDSHRNTSRMRELLKKIEATFDDLPRRHRRSIRERLSRTCRQLGYDHYHCGQYVRALRFFAESFWNRPDPRGLCHVLQAGVRVLGRGARARE